MCARRQRLGRDQGSSSNGRFSFNKLDGRRYSDNRQLARTARSRARRGDCKRRPLFITIEHRMSIKRQDSPALSPDALFAKSQTYIARALAAKGRSDLGEYQFWASLALELLGKSALAQIHPCLIADPQSSISIFAAAGVAIGTD